MKTSPPSRTRRGPASARRQSVTTYRRILHRAVPPTRLELSARLRQSRSRSSRHRSSRSAWISCSSSAPPAPHQWLQGGNQRCLAARATKGAVERGAKLIRELCEAHGTQLSQSFGNFDQLVGLGWLLGDLVLGCLISKDDALAVGRKAGKLAASLKKEFAAPRTRAGKKQFSSEQEQALAFAAADTEEAAIRQQVVELPFPAVRAARAQAAALERKRVKPDQPAPAPAPMRSHVPIERRQTHDSMGMEFASVHVSMLTNYMRTYRGCLDRASARVAEAAEELEKSRSAERRAESNVVDARLARDRQAKRPEPQRPPWMLDASEEEWLEAKDAWMERLRAHYCDVREADWAVDDARDALRGPHIVGDVRAAVRMGACEGACGSLSERHGRLHGPLLVADPQRSLQRDP